MFPIPTDSVHLPPSYSLVDNSISTSNDSEPFYRTGLCPSSTAFGFESSFMFETPLDNSRLTLCFYSTDADPSLGNGTAVLIVNPAVEGQSDNLLDVGSLCKALGIKEEDLDKCIKKVAPEGSFEGLDTTFTYGMLEFKFRDGFTELSLGILDLERIKYVDFIEAVRIANTMTMEEMNQFISDKASAVVALTQSSMPTASSTPPGAVAETDANGNGEAFTVVLALLSLVVMTRTLVVRFE